MNDWFRRMWADVPARIATIVVAITIPLTWFIWAGNPKMEAIGSIALAGWLATMWFRNLTDSEHPLIAPAVALTSLGLLLEAAFFLFTDERPIPVLLVWMTGLVLMLAVWWLDRREGTGPGPSA